MVKPVRCKTLLGHNNLDFSIECLQSFIRYSGHKVLLEIFEDGSITEADEEKLLSSLKNSVVVKKAERDVQLAAILAKYPACAAYRNSTNFSQKLFDVMLYDNQDVFYIDSDIYFLQKFLLPKFDEMPVFMYDNQNAYSFSPIDLLRINIPAFPNVNTGVFYFPTHLFDLDFIEQLLNDEVISRSFKKCSNWSEQTIWSLLAAKSRSISFFDYNQIIMADYALKTNSDTVAIHLVYYFRTHIKQLRLLPPVPAKDCSVIRLTAHSAYLSKMDFAIEKLKKKMKTLYQL